MNKKVLWIYILSSLVYFCQGIEGLPGLSLFLYMKEILKFTPEKVMYISSITTLAWLVKPLWGFLSDNYLSKKTWILLSLLGSIIISLSFGLIYWLPIGLIVLLLTLNNYNSASRDVAVDGIMCVEGKKYGLTGKIQAIQWISITIASIIVGLGGGYIAQRFNFKVGFICLIPIYIVILLVCSKYRTLVLKKEHKVNLLETIKSYKILCVNKRFLLVCLFLFLYKYSPSFGTPLMYIERDVFKWSAMWIGILGAIVSCCEIGGALLYFKYCKKIDLKKYLYISVWIGAFTSLAYLYFTPISAIFYAVIFAIMGMLIHLICMQFMADSSLPGKEATSFALLCSISNLAGTTSNLSGAILFPLVGLKFLIVISAITSFICLPLIKHLGIK